MHEAWDSLLERVVAIRRGESVPHEVLAQLCRDAQDAHVVDRELDPSVTGRALAALARGFATLEGDDDTDETTSIVAVTRWLHPARMDVR